MHKWVNEFALAGVMPFLLVVGVIGQLASGVKMGQINLGCEDTLHLLIEWDIGMPESLDYTFLCIGAHIKGFITLDLQLPHLWGVLSSS